MSESTWRGGRRAVIASALITLVLVFAVAEVGLRLSSLENRAFALNKLMVPGLAGDYFPNQDGRVALQTDAGPHAYRFTTNSQGFRGPEFSLEKPEGSFLVRVRGAAGSPGRAWKVSP